MSAQKLWMHEEENKESLVKQQVTVKSQSYDKHSKMASFLSLQSIWWLHFFLMAIGHQKSKLSGNSGCKPSASAKTLRWLGVVRSWACFSGCSWAWVWVRAHVHMHVKETSTEPKRPKDTGPTEDTALMCAFQNSSWDSPMAKHHQCSYNKPRACQKHHRAVTALPRPTAPGLMGKMG